MCILFLRLEQKGFQLAVRRKLRSGKSGGNQKKGLLYMVRWPIFLYFKLICSGKYKNKCSEKMYI